MNTSKRRLVGAFSAVLAGLAGLPPAHAQQHVLKLMDHRR